MVRATVRAVAWVILLAGWARPAAAGPIVAPVDGWINAGGPGFGQLADTFNQDGLSLGYVNGVTDFDAYLALNPSHTSNFVDPNDATQTYEWFSNEGATSASVTYDLGAAFLIGKLALWNEESSGIGLLNLFYSLDNVLYLPLALGLAPTDNTAQPSPGTPPYFADVFGFTPAWARYVRFDMSSCPQPDGDFDACAIGEVAFAAVPEPGTLLLVGGGLAVALRRRRRARR